MDDARLAGNQASPTRLSESSVPIVVEGEAVAVLNVESRRLGAFTDTDDRLLETLPYDRSA